MEVEKKREKLLDVIGAAEYLGMSVRWVYGATASGLLPCRKVGRKLRFLPSELEAWVTRQPGTPSEADV